MTITIEELQNIIKERNEIIAKLEEDLENQVEKLDELVDEVGKVKTITKELTEIIDSKNTNHVIANISNFLYEQNKLKEASILSQCILGKILISPLSENVTHRLNKQFIIIEIILYCTGDSFQKIKTDYDDHLQVEYHNAFKSYFTLSKAKELYKKTYVDSNKIIKSAKGVIIKYELNVKRISPKESDLGTFFKKVDRLKKMLKR